jgi:hypothetical protein
MYFQQSTTRRHGIADTYHGCVWQRKSSAAAARRSFSAAPDDKSVSELLSHVGQHSKNEKRISALQRNHERHSVSVQSSVKGYKFEVIPGRGTRVVKEIYHHSGWEYLQLTVRVQSSVKTGNSPYRKCNLV